jgi:Ala-tRNA(Pro) deacylase
MSISSRLAAYLGERVPHYEICDHPQSETSAQTARCAHVSPGQLAKSVLLEDEHGCVMAVLPADQRVHIDQLARVLGRHGLRLSDEARVKALFADCAPGAVPALGMAWGVETIVDATLAAVPEVYIEAGDHEQLIKLPRATFTALMRDARHAHFCEHRQH